ncbi:hypothetical protein DSO57_1029784 [Entomophthora muscae]|uniref:Uncharacterized protein n=1 Tax=Entomophthora muscae TaxID=34485 RepID=A0ACC2TMZ9_9FUNG|nr:hypothetical protein DSO57_1029784 [Entomophthora muscae]
MAPSKGHNELPNRGKKDTTIGLMSLMSTLATNQNPTHEENMSQRATLKNIAPEQKGCATLLGDPANKCPSWPVPFFCLKTQENIPLSRPQVIQQITQTSKMYVNRLSIQTELKIRKSILAIKQSPAATAQVSATTQPACVRPPPRRCQPVATHPPILPIPASHPFIQLLPAHLHQLATPSTLPGEITKFGNQKK